MNEKKQEIVDCSECVHYGKLECLDCERADLFEKRIINKQICNFCTHEEVCCDPEKYCCDVCKHYEEQRPHGEWKYESYGQYLSTYKCSNCGFHGDKQWICCPYCGADMRKEGDENDKVD